ncbi:hypothetical protein NL676_012457 [Syzygium grande]|nr:hypothetical protein NL676_012457 [Syzygium grande]
MLPMSIVYNIGGNHIRRGTKFHSRKEEVISEDPDCVLESGTTKFRAPNSTTMQYRARRKHDKVVENEKRSGEAEEMGDVMNPLQNSTSDFKREMVPNELNSMKDSNNPKQQSKVRIMLPMSIVCNICGNHIRRGTKFHSRKEEVVGEVDALGDPEIQVLLQMHQVLCRAHNQNLSMQDPDYVVESGATRNFETLTPPCNVEPGRKHDKVVENEKRSGEAKEMGDVMNPLENSTFDSKREMAPNELNSIKMLAYPPPSFEPLELHVIRTTKKQQSKVRIMLPMSIVCNTCGNHIWLGTKFHSGKEEVVGKLQTCLGIPKFKFYFKCTKCYAVITIKTYMQDPDCIVESWVTRNFEPLTPRHNVEPWRKQDEVVENEKRSGEAEEMGDIMNPLQNSTSDSKK